MGPKVPSERASCPRGRHCGAGEMGTDASWMSMENDQRCCAVCGESSTHGAQRGDEETYRKPTRLVPTQRECGFFRLPNYPQRGDTLSTVVQHAAGLPSHFEGA